MVKLGGSGVVGLGGRVVLLKVSIDFWMYAAVSYDQCPSG